MTNRERILLLEVEVKRLKKDNKKLSTKLDEATDILKNISDKVNGSTIQVSYVLNRRDDGYDESQFSRD